MQFVTARNVRRCGLSRFVAGGAAMIRLKENGRMPPRSAGVALRWGVHWGGSSVAIEQAMFHFTDFVFSSRNQQQRGASRVDISSWHISYHATSVRHLKSYFEAQQLHNAGNFGSTALQAIEEHAPGDGG
jgi:hypothetical protein